MRCFFLLGILYLTTFISGDEPKIIIIGAGVSGITAASKLYENGFENVTILEAENRIGGRIHTVWFHESWIDLGGQWVHGQENNTIFEMVWPLGLLEIPEQNSDHRVVIYNSKDLQLPNSISNGLVDAFDEITNDMVNTNGINGSVGEYITKMMNVEVKKYPTVNDTLLKQFLKLFEGFSMSMDAVENWWDLSLRGQREMTPTGGSFLVNWKDKGYSTILDILMKKFPNPEEELPVLNNTLLNSEVVKIDYQSIHGKVMVETIIGNQYIADHVILTPSLGVLKEQYETLFMPQLPESKIKTIKSLGFGTVAKIYLTFETVWWPVNSPHLLFLWDDDDRQEYENDPDRKWLVDLLGLNMVPNRPELICIWLTGASVRHMETLSEEKIVKQTFTLINKFLGNSYNITKVTGILRTQWYSNKHFRGTYSSRTMESERADVWAEQLATPLMVDNKPIIMFAGEATNSHFFGTVHGALETGQREAERIINLYKNISKMKN